MRLLVIGELNPDLIVAGVPAPNGQLRFGQAEDLVEATRMTLGSSAAITASAAVRAGAHTALAAVIGDDEFGRYCLRLAQEQGIDINPVRVISGGVTGSSVILISAEDRQNRQILTDLGTMTQLSTADLPDELLAQYAHVHVSSFFLHSGARHLLHERLSYARKAGATVSLDTNDDPAREWTAGAAEAIGQSDILFANDVELLGLSGLAGANSPEAAASFLLGTMPAASSSERSAVLPAVVRKRGAEGATVHTRDGTVTVGVPPVDIIDTVGAGDTLAGTVIAAVLAGSDWSVALALGVAAASLSTTAAGGVAAQPTGPDTALVAESLTTTIYPPQNRGGHQ